GLRRVAQQTEAFFRQLEEDVVFAGEVAVDRRGAVLDPLSDLADGDIGVALGDEEIARRVEDRSTDSLAITFLSLLDSHGSCWLALLPVLLSLVAGYSIEAGCPLAAIRLN